VKWDLLHESTTNVQSPLGRKNTLLPNKKKVTEGKINGPQHKKKNNNNRIINNNHRE